MLLYVIVTFSLSLILSIKAAAILPQVGAACLNNLDCGPNEFCRAVQLEGPTCRFGRCDCKPCFTQVPGSLLCVRINSLKLNDSCDGLVDERYPVNAYCNLVTNQVKCRGDQCYRETVDGNCQPIEQLARGEKCTTDCGCSSNMKCVSKCRCKSGFQWNGHGCRRKAFGDSCSTTTECATSSAYPFVNMVCMKKTCTCPRGTVPSQNGQIDPTVGKLEMRIVCVPGNSTEFARQGDRCSQRGPSNFEDPWVCEAGSLCHSCQNEDDGTCRRQVGEFRTFERCVPSVRSLKTTPSERISFLGKGCSNDSECGTNEVCDFPPLDPPCQLGQCRCKPCYGPNRNYICSPMRFRPLGSPCQGTANEFYPPAAFCYKNQVSCNFLHRLSPDGKRCFPDDYSWTTHGSYCESNADCLDENSQCDISFENQECDCALPNQRWDAEARKCVDRRIGDFCWKDEHCRGIATVGDYRNLPVCSRLYKVCTYRLDISRTREELEQTKCLMCPGESLSSTQCRKGIMQADEIPTEC